MTAATDELDRRIVAYLRRAERHYGAARTVAEITEALAIPMSSVRAAVKRLDAAGHVAQVGVTFNGARTWAAFYDESTP